MLVEEGYSLLPVQDKQTVLVVMVEPLRTYQEQLMLGSSEVVEGEIFPL